MPHCTSNLTSHTARCPLAPTVPHRSGTVLLEPPLGQPVLEHLLTLRGTGEVPCPSVGGGTPPQAPHRAPWRVSDSGEL